MRAFITGIAGFIGSHVADEMLRIGWDVAGIDDLTGGYVHNVPTSAQFLQRDCCNDLSDIFQDFKPDVVVHLAAYAAEGLSHHIPNFNYQNNLIGTSNVLAHAYQAGVKHFIFSSSVAAYGHPESEFAFSEEAVCRPADPYGVAKRACEQHIDAFFNYYGRPSYTIFRPHNVFGPRQNISDPYRNVVGIFFRCARQGLAFPIFGDGQQTRSFSYIDVVAKCIALATENELAKNEIFNVGGDQSLTVLELAELISDVYSTQPKFDFLPARKEVQHAHASHLKAKSVFPEVFANAVSVADGLKLMAEYVNQLEIPPPTPCPAPIEISDMLPARWRESK